MTLSLCKTLVRPHVEYCSKELIEKIQHRFTKMIKNMEGKLYKDRLRFLSLCTLKERQNRQDLIELFKTFKGLSRVIIDELFMLDENTKDTRGSLFEIKENSVHQGCH